MSGPTHARHEGFQGMIAAGAEAKGAYVVSARTNGPEDIVIFPKDAPMGVLGLGVPPLIVEVKTLGAHADHRYVKLDGPQLATQNEIAANRHGAWHVVLCYRVTPHRKKGEPSGEITYEINGHREWVTEERGPTNQPMPGCPTTEQRIFLYLAECWELGRAAYLARKGLVYAERAK